MKAYNSGGDSGYSNVATAQTAARSGAQLATVNQNIVETISGDTLESTSEPIVAAPSSRASTLTLTSTALNDESSSSTGHPRISSARVAASASVGDSPAPTIVLTSGGAEPNSDGWAVVDNDDETLWSGQADAGGWWIAIGYDRVLQASGVAVLCDEESVVEVMMLGSMDARNWYSLDEAWVESDALPLRYLWLIFPDDGSGIPPEIREVRTEVPESE